MKFMTTSPNQLSLSLIDEWLNEPLSLFTPLFNELNQRLESNTTKAEWFEDDGNYFARLDTPGLTKDDIELEFEDAEVRISIKTKDQTNVLRLRIPDGIIIETAEANLADGVLTLQLPKSPEKQPITIAVE